MAVHSYLKRSDYGFIGGGVLLSLLASLMMPNFVQDPMRIELYTRLIVGATILYGLFAIHSAIQAWAGELARYLQLIGMGLGVLMVAWVPHIGWHVAGNPQWFDMSATFWLTLFHSLTILGFGLASYGFHLFWKQA